MAYFSVKPDILKQNSSGLGQMESRLEHIQSQIRKVGSELDPGLESAGQLRSKLGRLAAQTGEYKKKISSMKSALNTIAAKYEQTEARIVRQAGGLSGNLAKETASGAAVSGAAAGALAAGNSGESLLHAGAAAGGTIFGINAAGSVSGDILGYETESKSHADWNLTKGEAGASWEQSVTGYAAKGTAKGEIGVFSGEITGTAVKGTAESALYAQLMKDGKFNPKVGGKAKVKGSVLEGEFKGQIGNKDFNRHISGKGSVLGGEAGVEAGIGNLGSGENGKTKYGARAEAGAEAYAAKGEVKSGLTIFGVDIDCTLGGKAGAIGAKAGGEVSQQGFSVNAGGSVILGVEVKIDVDWSDFELPKFEWPKWKF